MGLADLRVDDLDHGADQRARGVVLAAVPARVAHAPDAALVELGQFVALGLGIEGEPVDDFQHVAQDVAGAKLVAELGEDLANLVVDRARAVGGLPKRGEVGEQLAVDEADQVIADKGFVVVEPAFGRPGRRPVAPSEIGVDEGRVAFPAQLRPVTPLHFEIVQVFEKQHPGYLLHIVQLVGNACFRSAARVRSG